MSPKSAPKRKAAGKGRPPTKKTKKEESAEESEEEQDDEEEENEDDDEVDDSEEEDEDSGSDSKAKKGDGKGTKRGRASVNVGKNQPDKDGNMELYLFKNDLTKDFRNDAKLCMWRRDGASLLQKYLVVKTDDGSRDVFFNASSVYSCWEEKRKNDFFQIKVTLVGEKKDGRVKVIDIDELEKFAAEDRPKIDLTPKGKPHLQCLLVEPKNCYKNQVSPKCTQIGAERDPNEAEADEDEDEGEGLDDAEDEE